MDQFGKVKRIEVVERSKSGSVLTLGIVFEKGYVTVKNEYNIPYQYVKIAHLEDRL